MFLLITSPSHDRPITWWLVNSSITATMTTEVRSTCRCGAQFHQMVRTDCTYDRQRTWSFYYICWQWEGNTVIMVGMQWPSYWNVTEITHASVISPPTTRISYLQQMYKQAKTFSILEPTQRIDKNTNGEVTKFYRAEGVWEQHLWSNDPIQKYWRVQL